MDKILSQMIEGSDGSNILAIAIVMAISIVFNIEKIYKFFDSRKKLKIGLIEDSLKHNCVQGSTRIYLENLIESEYFKSITGISLEKEVRDAMLEAYLSANGHLKFKHFKRAIPYYEFKNSKLSVHISKLSVLGFLYNLMIGFLMMVAAVFLFISPMFTPALTFVKVFSLYGVAILTVLMASLMLYQSLPVLSAKYVKDHLEKS